jgi:hypothetical protein
MEHRAVEKGTEDLNAIIRFLYRTADGEYTEVPPLVVGPSRVPDLREPVHEKNCRCIYTN